MTAVVATGRRSPHEEREASRPGDAGRPTTRAYEPVRERGGRPRTLECDAYSPFDDGVTLEDKILGVWEDLVVEGRAACPVCGGSMAPATGCSSCGSELS